MSKEINALVLDDEKGILLSLKRTFLNESFDIATTSDHEEALEILEKEEIKVVLSDYRMPKISGTEFLKMVKDKRPDVIRILFTGYADFAAAEDAINVGEVFRFISKPWNAEELKSTVNKAIEYFDLVQHNRLLLKETREKNEHLEVALKKLKASYEVQKEFTSTVSHELRTPLASIKTAIDIVTKKTIGEINAQQEEVLGRAKKNVDRLKLLINDILDLSKIESGKTTLNFQKDNINNLVRETADVQRAVMENKGLSLDVQCDDSIPEFMFDPDRLVQVMTNLVNNAIKFTQEGGITIRTENKLSDNHVAVHIQDTGKGIAEESLHKLFQKFQQVESAVANEEGGTGLGLAICKEIITRHGGKIWVTSQVDQGSTFSFILPIEERRSDS